jgi:hypothetical protein
MTTFSIVPRIVLLLFLISPADSAPLNITDDRELSSYLRSQKHCRPGGHAFVFATKCARRFRETFTRHSTGGASKAGNKVHPLRHANGGALWLDLVPYDAKRPPMRPLARGDAPPPQRSQGPLAHPCSSHQDRQALRGASSRPCACVCARRCWQHERRVAQVSVPLYAAGLKGFFTKTTQGLRHDFNPDNKLVYKPVSRMRLFGLSGPCAHN